MQCSQRSLGQSARFLLLLESRNVRPNPTSSFKAGLTTSLACLVQVGVLRQAFTSYKQSYQISISRIYKPENDRNSLALAYTAVEKEESGMDRSRWQVGEYVGKEVPLVHCRQTDRQTDRRAGGRAGRQAGRQAGRRAGRQAGRRAGRQAGRRAGRQAGRQAGGRTDRRTDGRTDGRTDS
jgi:hypothetical protein